MHPRLPHLPLATAALLALGLVCAGADPQGPSVVGGSATVQGLGSGNVQVNQTSSHAIINWNTFNIGAGQRVNFVQPGSSAIALNRVTGGLGPSQIHGTLTANGRVFLINRDGILFGPSAVVNTAGFLATTNDIKNADFMSGKYNFTIPGRPDASIVNQGRITAASGGFAALVAPGVRNSGTITATLGTVALAAGNSFTLDFYGDKLITLSVGDEIAAKVIDVQTGQPLKSLVTNTGKIKANGGRVELTAAAARHVVDSVINTSGVIKANSIGQRNGMIVLGAATASGKPAGAPTQTVRVSGKISAAGRKGDTKGGTVVVTGENIVVAKARIDASGRAGGGKVLIGGDWAGGKPDTSLVNNQSAKLETFAIPTASTVSIDAASRINASARDSGNGGKVVIWSDTQTTFAGTILANGGASGGNGGFVETSSHGQLNFAGNVDTRAPRGMTGTLLLDPYDITISSSATFNGSFGGNTFTPSGNSSVLNNIDLQNQLANNNVIVTTGGAGSPGTQTGNINVAANVTWSSASTLTLSAYNNITISSGFVISNTGSGNLVLRADNSGTGTGYVALSSGGVDFSASTGRVSVYYNPTAGYNNPTYPYDYSTLITKNPAVSNQVTAYMLVNTPSNLTDISNNLNGTYALGRDIDAGVRNPIGTFSSPFTGVLDGNGGLGVNYTIRNLTIAPNNPNTQSIGLFSAIGTSGIVRNINFTNANVSANPGFNSSNGNSQFVGIVAGQNLGLVSGINVDGRVNGGNILGVVAGGAVGQNGSQSGNPTGTITNTNADVLVTVGNGTDSQPNIAGGLVGTNLTLSTTSNSTARGNVSGGSAVFVGGLVGQNGVEPNGSNPIPGAISNSWASGNVSAAAPNSAAGGLAGSNSTGSTITNSQAFGTVTITGAAGSNFASAGGLVGTNQGSVTGTSQPTSTNCAAGASWSCASGSVRFGQNGVGGGLVGFNRGTGSNGLILNTFATGPVTGAPGDPSTGNTNIGGLVGTNQGQVSFSYATGNVGSANVGSVNAGGLVSDNSGRIDNSFATGNVSAGNNSFVGGLVSTNSNNNVSCGGPCNTSALIVDALASGNVTAGSASVAGGLAGSGNGTFLRTLAGGNVSTLDNSVAGGLVGVLEIGGTIQFGGAAGAVTSTGPNSAVGGFVGVNGGTITLGVSAGPVSVTGSSQSILGGFVAVNLGTIALAATLESSSVTALGNGDIMGGFFGLNLGSITDSISRGPVQGGTNGTVGGFGGANATYVNFDPGTIPGSSFPTGTVANSVAQGTASGGSGSKVDPFVALTNPSQSQVPAYPALFASCPDRLCEILRTGIFGGSSPSAPQPPVQPLLPQLALTQLHLVLQPQPQVLYNLVDFTQFAALNTAAVVNVTPLPAPPNQSQQPPTTQPAQQPGGFQRIIDIPPLNETRFLVDQVMVQILSGVTLAQLEDAIRPFGLTLIASHVLSATGTTAVTFRIPDGRPVRDVIRQLASVQIAAIIQPVYVYAFAQQPAPPPPAADTPPADSQYIIDKLKLAEAHRIVTGNNVTIAVVDSEIDAAHPALSGAITQRYSAVDAPEKPHAHGTGMAGAIASRQALTGIAPGARLFAVNAFATSATSAEGTTFQILKGLDWATSQGARVINMSFAGPKDPSLERAIKAAYDRNIVLVAAAGNAGPRAAPQYPGADANVIAVTATDVDDKLFDRANRGRYVAVAAPGVDIIVPAPEGAYQLTTGTSVAAAEVSGLVALLLERNPNLKPADIRRILTASAKRLGPTPRDDNFGSGLINPLKAIQAATDARVSAAPPLQR